MNHSLSRRDALTVLALGALGIAAGCGGAYHTEISVLPGRLILPVGGIAQFITHAVLGVTKTLPPASLPTGITLDTVAELFQADNTAVPGRYFANLQITATDPSGVSTISRPSSIELLVIPAGHGIALLDTRQSTDAAGTGSVEVESTQTLTAGPGQTGFAGPVTFRADGLPVGARATFTPATLTIAQHGMLQQPAVPSTTRYAVAMPPGSTATQVTFTIVGVHGSPAKEATVTVTIPVSPVAGASDGIDFSNVTAPIPTGRLAIEGTYYDRTANERLGDYGQSTTVLRDFTITVADKDGLTPGKRYAIGYAPLTTGCEITFVLQGGDPYYMPYRAQAGVGGITMEAIDADHVRLTIEGHLHFISNGADAKGSFDVSGSFVLRKNA